MNETTNTAMTSGQTTNGGATTDAAQNSENLPPSASRPGNRSEQKTMKRAAQPTSLDSSRHKWPRKAHAQTPSAPEAPPKPEKPASAPNPSENGQQQAEQGQQQHQELNIQPSPAAKNSEQEKSSAAAPNATDGNDITIDQSKKPEQSKPISPPAGQAIGKQAEEAIVVKSNDQRNAEVSEAIIAELQLLRTRADENAIRLNHMQHELNSTKRVHDHLIPHTDYTVRVEGAALWKPVGESGDRMHYDTKCIIRYDVKPPYTHLSEAASYNLDGHFLQCTDYTSARREDYEVRYRQMEERKNAFEDSLGHGTCIKGNVAYLPESTAMTARPICGCINRYTTKADLHNDKTVCHSRFLFQHICLAFTEALHKQPLSKIKMLMLPESALSTRYINTK